VQFQRGRSDPDSTQALQNVVESVITMKQLLGVFQGADLESLDPETRTMIKFVIFIVSFLVKNTRTDLPYLSPSCVIFMYFTYYLLFQTRYYIIGRKISFSFIWYRTDPANYR
jgi:hypothetical protein